MTGWEIVGGADRFEFSIAPDTGELSFQTAPDYESPADVASGDPMSGAGDNEYVVTVEVRSGAGARELTAEQTFLVRVTDEQEPPEGPEAPDISGETTDSLTVSWSEPENTGPPITDYDVQYREKGTGRFTDGGHEGPGLSLTLSDLEPGTSYEVQVRAVNALGKGGAETVRATPELRIAPPPPRGGGGGGGGGGLLFPPEAPAALMATPGDGMVRLEWSPPESDGGTPILRYEYRLKELRGKFGEWTPIEDSAPDEVNAGGYTVGGLLNGTVYVFELRAVNLVDEGPESEAVEVVMGLDRAYWSNFRAEDLEAEEAGLEHTPFGGVPRRLRLRFGAGLRFEEDDGASCEVRLSFTESRVGGFVYDCGEGNPAEGSFRLTTGSLFVPVILSAAGRNRSFFTNVMPDFEFCKRLP